jgi:molybdopterin-guanine dinucleotide biosynthesis protein A
LDVNCIVLAGGKSIRLGHNKLLEKVGTQNLLERVITKLAYFNSQIYVVIAQDSALPNMEYHTDVKVIKDIIPGKGSLGGLYSGLTFSDRPYNLAAACDMPFLNLELFRHMIDLAEGYDAVVPQLKDNTEPLHSVYSRSCLPAMQYLIEQNRLSIKELYSMIKVRYLDIGDIDKLDPRHLSFFNINTESDLQAGKEIAEQGDE